MASGPITSWEIDGETVETVSDFILGVPKSLQMVTAAMKLKDAYSLAQRRDRASGVLPDILEHLPPKTRVCLLYCFVLSPLTLLGAVPHHYLPPTTAQTSLIHLVGKES